MRIKYSQTLVYLTITKLLQLLSTDTNLKKEIRLMPPDN